MPPPPRQVAILGYPGAQSLDVTGPLEVFDGASRLIAATGRGEPAYEVRLYAPAGAPLETSSGLTLVPDATLGRSAPKLDTLIVAGGSGSREAADDPTLLRWVARAAARARRTASVCTGAFILAQAGLLDGRRATTHWSAATELARLHPGIEVDPEPIFIRDGDVWTSSGVTAGMDLALARFEL